MATLSVAPGRVDARAPGVVLHLTGTGTAWLSTAPAFTASKGTVVGQSVLSDTTAMLTYHAPPLHASVTLTDPSTGATATLAVHVPPRRKWFAGLR